MESLEKAQRAWEIYKSLTKDDKFDLRPYIRNIHGTQELISGVEDDMDAKTECKKCGGTCCISDIEASIDRVDYLYIFSTVSRWEREDIWKTLLKDNSGSKNCRFKSKKGCIIPDLSRPHVCKTFYCDRNRELQSMMKLFRLSLYGQFKMLENELKGRGYEF